MPVRQCIQVAGKAFARDLRWHVCARRNYKKALPVKPVKGTMVEVNLKRHSRPYPAGPCDLTKVSEEDFEQLGRKVTWVPTGQL